MADVSRSIIGADFLHYFGSPRFRRHAKTRNVSPVIWWPVTSNTAFPHQFAISHLSPLLFIVSPVRRIFLNFFSLNYFKLLNCSHIIVNFDFFSFYFHEHNNVKYYIYSHVLIFLKIIVYAFSYYICFIILWLRAKTWYVQKANFSGEQFQNFIKP